MLTMQLIFNMEVTEYSLTYYCFRTSGNMNIVEADDITEASGPLHIPVSGEKASRLPKKRKWDPFEEEIITVLKDSACQPTP